MSAGLSAHREGTLVDRALLHLTAGPADSTHLTHQVLGIPMATPVVADGAIFLRSDKALYCIGKQK